MIKKILKSPPFLYVSLLLIASFLFGIANNALRSEENKMGWFDGQEVIEVYN